LSGASFTLRVWAEFLPHAEAARPQVVDLLSRFKVGLNISVPQGSLGPDLACLLKTYANSGLDVALWLLLDDVHGYWPSERNVEHFSAYVDEVLNWAGNQDLPLPWIVVDLEPPYYQVAGHQRNRGLQRLGLILRLAWENLDAARFRQATRAYETLQRRIHAAGVKTLVPLVEFAVEDIVLGDTVIQDFLEAPALSVPWDLVSCMTYNTMTAGYSQSQVSLADARFLQYLLLRDLARALGERAGASVGLTGVGKLGDEPTYEDPADLALDVGTALMAGIRDISVFNLEGILHRPDPAAWLRAAREAQPASPTPTPWAARERRQRQLLARLLAPLRHRPRQCPETTKRLRE